MELLAVIVIVTVLATVAFQRYTAVRHRAFLAQLRSDLKNLAILEELRYGRVTQYSDDLELLGMEISEGVTLELRVEPVGGNPAQAWVAEGKHDRLSEDVGCVIYGGEIPGPTTPGGVQATLFDFPTCDEL